MSPELQRIVEQLRDWHTRSTATTADPTAALRMLGEGEFIVGVLLEQLDREGAADGMRD